MNSTQLSRQLLAAAKSLVALDALDYPKSGYYIVESPVRMGLGAWRVVLRDKGEILWVDRDLYLYRWVPEREEFVKISTPVQGRNFKFNWTGRYDDLSLVNPFLDGTRPLPNSEFKKMTREMVVDGTMQVKKAIALLQNADPNSSVYIRLKKNP